MAEINDFEWGRLVTVVESLGDSVKRLDNKIDQFLIDLINRREFDSLEKRCATLEKKVGDLQRDYDRSKWIEKVMTIVASTVINGIIIGVVTLL
jgi:hypothetical protein